MIQAPDQGGNRVIVLEIDVFIFDGPPEALIKNIIKGAPFAVHTNLDLCGFQDLRKGRGGELRPLVGVKNLGSPLSQRLL